MHKGRGLQVGRIKAGLTWIKRATACKEHIASERTLELVDEADIQVAIQ
jgi:hypothetical protein